MENVKFKVDGMHCDGCADRIRTVVTKQPGVRSAEVSFETGEACIEYNPHAVTETALAAVIAGAGFQVAGG